MKIKKVISINLVNSNLNIFKLGQLENKLKIKNINIKPLSKYIEIEHDLPKSNISLIRNKTDSLCHYGYGYIPNTSYYYIPSCLNNDNLLDNNNNSLDNVTNNNNLLDNNNNSEISSTGYKINSVYKFNTKFFEEDSEKSNLQFRKVESREEIEHRKRNINYKIKNIENESFVKKEYNKLNKDILKLSINNKKDNKYNKCDIEKIERCIKNRVVVNYKDIYNLFITSKLSDNNKFNHLNKEDVFNNLNKFNKEDVYNNMNKFNKEEDSNKEDVNNKFNILNKYIKEEDISKEDDYIKLSLQRCTFFFKGRYILKNKYYDKYLQEIRTEILERFNNSDKINKNNLDNLDYKNMIEELCIKKEDGYYLKGSFEDLVIDFKNTGLLNELKNKLIFNIQDIKEISKLEMEDIYKFINENNLIEIKNNYYCIESTDEIEEVIKLTDRTSIKKSEINEIVSEKEYNVEEFFKIFEKYFILKRATWFRI